MFKVGDRVQAVKGCRHYYPAGALGTVLEVGGSNYYVDFDKAIGVHVNINGTHSWYVTTVIAAPVAPASRSNDPATSKGKRRINKYEQAVLSELTGFLTAGRTGKEIAAASGHPLNCITPRFAPLRRKGLIKALEVPIEWNERRFVPKYVKRDKQIVWVLA